MILIIEQLHSSNASVFIMGGQMARMISSFLISVSIPQVRIIDQRKHKRTGVAFSSRRRFAYFELIHYVKQAASNEGSAVVLRILK